MRRITLSFVVSVVLALFALLSGFPIEAGAESTGEGPIRARATVVQTEGKDVYWVLPGKRRLSLEVFGTPDNPKFTLEEKLETVENPVVRDLLKQLPELVSAPLKHRKISPDGTRFTVYEKPTLFSDRAVPLSSEVGRTGSFEARFIDRVDEDQSGPPGETPDEARLTAKFHDPEGNLYRVKLDHVIQPPFPGYRTRGGVMIDNFHHGTTGTGSPLMPKLYTRAALWGAGKITVNGDPLDGMRVIHLMTTQVVRDRDYNLALDEELPLEKKRRHIPGQRHHTHLVVLPVKPIPDKGPTYHPDVTRYSLENGDTQPFIHVMFERDRITQWDLSPGEKSAGSTGESSSDANAPAVAQEVTIVARKLKFKPDSFTVKKGRPVRLTFQNDGFISHSFDIPELDVHAESIQPGDSLTVSFSPNESGTFEFICDVAEHKLAGMKGTMTVE